MTERPPIEVQRRPLPPRRDGNVESAERPGARFGRRLLGTALLIGSIGLASCHGFVLAIFG